MVEKELSGPPELFGPTKVRVRSLVISIIQFPLFVG